MDRKEALKIIATALEEPEKYDEALGILGEEPEPVIKEVVDETLKEKYDTLREKYITRFGDDPEVERAKERLAEKEIPLEWDNIEIFSGENE